MTTKPTKTAIKVDSVFKSFRIPKERVTSLKQLATHFLKARKYETLNALSDVSFEIKKGEFFGIIGRNGSGKSTLLKILAQIYKPDSGEVKTHGHISPFIELGVGFHPELTARENLYLGGAILGLTRSQVDAKYREIVDFAELESFMDQKFKNFSSGMQVRLAFSLAIQAHSEILLIDEVLAVGDSNFQSKCYDVFLRLKKEGKTIIFVSHDLESIKSFSSRVLVMESGKVLGIYPPETALAKYSKLNMERNEAILEAKGAVRLPSKSDIPHITSVEMSDINGKPIRAVTSGDPISFKLTIKNPKQQELNAGVAIYRNDGFYCFGTNTVVDYVTIPQSKATEVVLNFSNISLGKGSYYLVVGLFGANTNIIYEMHDRLLWFAVYQTGHHEGLTYLDHRWKV